MFKNIKKLIKYLIIFLGVIVMVPVFLYSVLQISAVQTFIVQRDYQVIFLIKLNLLFLLEKSSTNFLTN